MRPGIHSRAKLRQLQARGDSVLRLSLGTSTWMTPYHRAA